MNKPKPYFRDKGRYTDGRKRVIIEWKEGRDIKSQALPKPEKLKEILSKYGHEDLDNKQ